jgi:hypothetical protein
VKSDIGKESICENCGNFDPREIADKFLCAECVILAGSSCAGGGDDEN